MSRYPAKKTNYSLEYRLSEVLATNNNNWPDLEPRGQIIVLNRASLLDNTCDYGDTCTFFISPVAKKEVRSYE